MAKTNTPLLKERHARMLDYQKEIAPFIASFDELREIWNVSSKSVVQWSLIKLEEMGLVITRKVRLGKQYYAIKEADNGTRN